MDSYVLVEMNSHESPSPPVIQGVVISFQADLEKLRALSFQNSDFKCIESQAFEFVQDGVQFRCHVKVQEQLSKPGFIGIFLHHCEGDQEIGHPPPLSLTDWELGVMLPDGQKLLRKMKDTALGAHGMGWPEFIGPGSIPSGTSNLEVVITLNHNQHITIRTT